MVKKYGNVRDNGSKSRGGLTHRAVVSMINARKERKNFPASHAAGTAGVIAGTGYRVSGGIIQGDTSTTRDGARIDVEKLEIIFHGFGDTVDDSTFRILVVQDKQANASDMSVQQLLNSAGAFSPYHPVIQQEQKRFHILKDMYMDLSATGMNNKTMRFSIKPLRQVYYLDSTDVSTACAKNFIWIWVLATNTSSTYSLQTSQTFTDA